MAETLEQRVERLSKELGVPDEVTDEQQPSVSGMLTPQQPEPSFFSKPIENIVEPTLGGAGALAGGMLGARGGLPGAIAGGALGYAGGAALARPLKFLTGEEKSPTSALDELKKTGNLILEGGAFEAGGRLIGKVVEGAGALGKSLLRGLIAGQVKPLTPEQQMIVNTTKEMGVQLRPSELSQSDVAAQVEQNARRSLYGRGKFQRLDDENSANLIHFYDTLAEKNWGQSQTPQELGRVIQQAVRGEVLPDVAAVNRGLYQVLSRQTGEAPIVSSNLSFNKAQELSKKFDEKVFPKSHAIAKNIEEILSQTGPTSGLPIKGAAEGTRIPKNLTFTQAMDARSKLLELGRTGELLGDREKYVATNLSNSIDDAMEQAAKSYDAKNGTSIYQDWRIANASVKASHELFDSAIIKRAMSATPEDVAKTAFTKQAVTETERVMEALRTSPTATKSYQQSAFKELLQRSQVGGKLDPHKMFEQAYGKNGVGEEVMNKTFQERAPALRNFMQATKNMNLITTFDNVNPSQTGRSLINWFEQGMVLSLPISLLSGSPGSVGAAAATNAVYMISIDQLARMVNSPRGLKLMTAAVGLKPNTKEGLRIGGLLVKELAKTAQPEQGAP